jgi:hypothetical protein
MGSSAYEVLFRDNGLQLSYLFRLYFLRILIWSFLWCLWLFSCPLRTKEQHGLPHGTIHIKQVCVLRKLDEVIFGYHSCLISYIAGSAIIKIYLNENC